MFYQIWICLTRPREIGRFLLDRIGKSILMIILLITFSITPYVITLAIADVPSHDNYDLIADKLMSCGDDLELKIQDGALVGEKSYSFSLDDTNLLITPNNESYEYSDTYEKLEPLLTYGKDKVTVCLFGEEIYSKSYSELGIKEIDFNKIMNEDYLEMNKFFDSLTKVYNDLHVSWVVYYSVGAFIEIFISAIILAFILSFVARLAKKGVGRRFGFKLGLDCQAIMIFFIFLAFLTGWYFLQYIGDILAAIYLLLALKSIISIRKEPIKKEENDNVQ